MTPMLAMATPMVCGGKARPPTGRGSAGLSRRWKKGVRERPSVRRTKRCALSWRLSGLSRLSN